MHRLSGAFQHYAWGSADTIPRLLGIDSDGEPHAEYWLGAHPNGPAHDQTENRPLGEVLAAAPELIGADAVERFGPQLPFLLKVLSAAQPLSLQTHPNRDQAEEGYAREDTAGIELDAAERVYHDRWPKPELIIALEPLEVLCGFRDPHHTHALFQQLGVHHELDSVVGPLVLRSAEAAMAETFLDALGLDDARRHLVNEVVSRAVDHVAEDGDFGDFCRLAVQLDEYHPGSPSILAALLMNRVLLQPGQALFLPSGNLHSYLRGTGVEVMASSDNVIRCGLTKKHIDVTELVRVVNFRPGPVAVIDPSPEGPGLWRYVTPAPEFATWRIEVSSEVVATVPVTSRGRILLVLDGHLSDQHGTELIQGQSAFIPAGDVVQLHGDAFAVLVASGV